MATKATVLWNANTEIDLLGYTVSWTLYPGVYSGYPQASGAIAATITSYSVDSAFIPSDGLWYFTIEAFDNAAPSPNISPKAVPVTKRIIRTPSKLVVRR